MQDTVKVADYQDAQIVMEKAQPLTNFCDCGLEKPVTRDWCQARCPALRKYLRIKEGIEAGRNSYDASFSERMGWA